MSVSKSLPTLSMLSLNNLSAAVLLAIVFTASTWMTTPHANTGGAKLNVSQQPIPDFKTFRAGTERKNAFFDFMTPMIHHANQQVLQDRKKLIQTFNEIQLNQKTVPTKHQVWLFNLADYYDVEDFDPLNPKHRQTLLKRVDIVPTSLAIAQAANESAWGTSRFARKANNYFGQWCYSKGCGLIPKQRTEGAKHEVRAFKHPYESVKSYIRNLNTQYSYQTLRQIRWEARQDNKLPTGLQLSKGLINYSQRRGEYVKELQSMIRYNKLSRFNLKPTP